jgi:hypothetical protein
MGTILVQREREREREREHIQMPTWQFGLVQEKFKDIKGIIRSRISKNNRQFNDQSK